jgi:hypothetical protein
MTGFLKQLQDRVYQANVAGYEISNVDKQIETQNQRITIMEQDITQQQKFIDNASETLDFLKTKYTNDALYSYMENGLRGLYYQVYTLAYQLAKKAERTYQFERVSIHPIPHSSPLATGTPTGTAFSPQRDSVTQGKTFYFLPAMLSMPKLRDAT